MDFWLIMANRSNKEEVLIGGGLVKLAVGRHWTKKTKGPKEETKEAKINFNTHPTPSIAYGNDSTNSNPYWFSSIIPFPSSVQQHEPNAPTSYVWIPLFIKYLFLYLKSKITSKTHLNTLKINKFSPSLFSQTYLWV